MVSKKTFAVGDYVFAKVKGYPPWPAKVTAVEKSRKYSVWFYGTGETAKCKAEEIYKYQDKKNTYANDKARSKPDFKKAYDQIENAIADPEQDECPFGNPNAPVENPNELTMEDKENETQEELDNTEIETTFNESRISANSTINDKTVNDETDTPADVEASQVEAPNDTTNDTAPVKVEIPEPETPKETPKENEPKSRSGRTIKVRKYEDAATEEDLMMVQSGLKRKAVLSEDKSPNKKIKKEPKKEVKREEKPIVKDDFPNSPVIDRKTLWDLETTLVELNFAIKSSVGLTNADAEKCVSLLEDMKKLNMTKLMLMKNPNCVETIKRLRKYIGNTKNWNLEADKEQTFRGHAREIRAKATEIYDGFKKMFSSPADIPFWDFFTEEVKKFEFATRNLTKEDVYHLVDEKEVPPFDPEEMRAAEEEALADSTVQNDADDSAANSDANPEDMDTSQQNDKANTDDKDEGLEETDMA